MHIALDVNKLRAGNLARNLLLKADSSIREIPLFRSKISDPKVEWYDQILSNVRRVVSTEIASNRAFVEPHCQNVAGIS